MICECGCGQEVKPGNRFINGHNSRYMKVSDPIKDNIAVEGITQDLVRELFDYRDGALYWKVIKSHRIKIGDLAGWDRKDRYQEISINCKIHEAHRLIFLYHHGYLPEFIDHIDRNILNNTISNLREATRAQNRMNTEKCKSKKGPPMSSQFKGVSWDKSREKWMSYIYIDYKRKHLGRFDSEIDAALAYNKTAIELFGEFACLNVFDEPKCL